VVIAANPTDMLRLLYAEDYARFGGPALGMLALGNVAFSVFAINGTILNGAGETRAAIIAAGITLALAAIGNYIAIPYAVEDGSTLVVAAAVTGGAMVVGAILSGVLLTRKLGAFLPILSLVRIGIATGAALAVGKFLVLPPGKLMTLVEAGVVGVVFLVVLIGTRELGARDLAAIKAVRKKRAADGGDA
jgi:O-antigen/teichoic acid export membrane protein